MQTLLRTRGHQYVMMTLLLAITLAIAGQFANSGAVWGAAAKSPISSANTTLAAFPGSNYHLAYYRYYYPRYRYYAPRYRYYAPRYRYYAPRYRYYAPRYYPYYYPRYRYYHPYPRYYYHYRR